MSTPTPPFRYVTPQAVIDVLAPDGDLDGTAASLDTAVLLDEIAAAEDRIDAAIGTRYTLPLSPVPNIVVRIARDLATFNADMAYRGQSDYTSQFNPLLMRKQAAEQLLKEIAGGNADLGQPEPTTIADGGAGRARNVYSGRLFSPNDPTNGDRYVGRGPSRWAMDHTDSRWW